MSQMKEQDKITARDLNDTEISNMPDREFKIVIIAVLTGFEKRVEDLSETLNRDRKHKKEKKPNN